MGLDSSARVAFVPNGDFPHHPEAVTLGIVTEVIAGSVMPAFFFKSCARTKGGVGSRLGITLT